jgi:hypothetical protein
MWFFKPLRNYIMFFYICNKIMLKSAINNYARKLYGHSCSLKTYTYCPQKFLISNQ